MEAETDFDMEFLRAMRTLAVRSPRAQADVQAALFAAGLHATPDDVTAALVRLVNLGLIRDVIRLQDGGVLVTVSLAVN